MANGRVSLESKIDKVIHNSPRNYHNHRPNQNTPQRGGGGGGGEGTFFTQPPMEFNFLRHQTTHGIQFPPTPTTHGIRKFGTQTTHRIQFS